MKILLKQFYELNFYLLMRILFWIFFLHFFRNTKRRRLVVILKIRESFK